MRYESSDLYNAIPKENFKKFIYGHIISKLKNIHPSHKDWERGPSAD